MSRERTIVRLESVTYEPDPLIDFSVPFFLKELAMRTRTSLIVLIAAALLGTGFVLAPAQQTAGGGAKGDGKTVDRDRYQKLFKDHGDFIVGGVWLSTDAKGNKSETRYEWILD